MPLDKNLIVEAVERAFQNQRSFFKALMHEVIDEKLAALGTKEKQPPDFALSVPNT